MKIATSEQMRGLDRSAIRERGIPSLQLMDRAAAAVVERCLERMAGKEKKRVAVFCGAGNNGGDGVAAARAARIGAPLYPTLPARIYTLP